MVGVGSPVVVIVMAVIASSNTADISAIAEIIGATAVNPIVIANVVSAEPASFEARNVTVRSWLRSVGVPDTTPPESVTPSGRVLFSNAIVGVSLPVTLVFKSISVIAEFSVHVTAVSAVQTGAMPSIVTAKVASAVPASLVALKVSVVSSLGSVGVPDKTPLVSVTPVWQRA